MDVVIEGKVLTVNIYNKERYLGYGYLVISMLPFVFYRTDSAIEFAFMVVFCVVLWWAALLALVEKEYCVVDKEKKTIKVTSSTLFNTTQRVHDLENLLDCKLSKAPEDKNSKMQRIVFLFNDGIEIPLTATYYSDLNMLKGVAKKIDDFVG